MYNNTVIEDDNNIIQAVENTGNNNSQLQFLFKYASRNESKTNDYAKIVSVLSFSISSDSANNLI